MVSPERLAGLERQWAHLVGPFGGDPAALHTPFDALIQAYQEPHRHYHTLSHLGDVLRAAPRLLPAGVDPAPVLLAAWFHDAVYDPKRSDNEERSADLATALLPDVNVPAGVVAEVCRLVWATAHLTDDAPTDAAAVALLDADLAVLGAAEPRYRQYAAGVRAEYAHVSDADYRAGRRAVLAAFLARPAIYRHPLMRAEGESAARANLAAELATLGPASG